MSPDLHTLYEYVLKGKVPIIGVYYLIDHPGCFKVEFDSYYLTVGNRKAVYLWPIGFSGPEIPNAYERKWYQTYLLPDIYSRIRIGTNEKRV